MFALICMMQDLTPELYDRPGLVADAGRDLVDRPGAEVGFGSELVVLDVVLVRVGPGAPT